MTENHQFKRTIYALGETVLDLVSDGGFTMQAVPGGSVLNASVSLGRMKSDVRLISEFGMDKAGELIDRFLLTNGVKTDFCIRHESHKTALALAFLDEAKNASYTFYHDSPADLQLNELPDFSKNDILLFGSFYSVKPERYDFVKKILLKASDAGSVIYYDLNIRKAKSADFNTFMPSYLENISAATIVKGSDEDFMSLFGLSDPAAIYEKVCSYCDILIITNGSKPLHLFTPSFSKTYSIPKILPVSTIGAGDNFNAGFIYGLSQTVYNLKQIKNIPAEEMDKMVACGIAFANETCLATENYISGNFAPDFWRNFL